MLPSATNEIGLQVQNALTAGNFAAADPLILQFSECVHQQIALAFTDEQRLALTKEVLAQLSDWLHLARVLRSHVSSALNSADAESQYLAYK